jgi:hypothetical protein
MESQTITAPVAGYTSLALTDNPNRISALIENVTGDTTRYVIVVFDYANTTTAAVILAGGSLQIDADLPWTGPVALYAAGSGDCQCVVTEISIE